MIPTQVVIAVYYLESDRAPYNEWIFSLTDHTAIDAITKRIARLRLGLLGDVKYVGCGVWEMRIDVGPGYRVYYGQHGRVLIILLCGGRKKAQNRDIEKAHSYWADYRRRNAL